ncbi:MAG: class I SAM-dependent methyltransferase, partial [Methanosarcinales archaeon]
MELVMLLHKILNLKDSDEIYLVEENYINQRDLPLTMHYLGILASEKDLLKDVKTIKVVDEFGEIIGIATYNPETPETPAFWSVFTNVVNIIANTNKNNKFLTLTNYIYDSVDPNNKKIFQTTRKEFWEGVIEYYSLLLVNRSFCERCTILKESYEMIYNRNRVNRIKELIKSLDSYLNNNILEICCGNGMSSIALHEIGYSPVTIDNDMCAICQGLEHKVLNPHKTIVMDATRLSYFFSEDNKFDCVVGFMLGTIYEFNKNIWITILQEAVKVVKEKGTLLFTVRKKEEIDFVKDTLENFGVKGDIIDNRDNDGIYDQWVYLGCNMTG